jgi:hypothetical protein
VESYSDLGDIGGHNKTGKKNKEKICVTSAALSHSTHVRSFINLMASELSINPVTWISVLVLYTWVLEILISCVFTSHVFIHQ